MNKFSGIIDRFISWGQASDKLSAAFIIGSQAREDHQADEYSDVDLVLIVDDIDYFVFSDQWLTHIGDYHISFVEDGMEGGKERRILFDDALDVDFIIMPRNMLNSSGENIDNQGILRRGYRVIIDKIGFADTLLSVPSPKQTYIFPTEQECQNTVNDFWFHVVWTAKKLKRGELWTAKSCLDCYMKEKLLYIIECHAHAINGIDHDTWHNGRFLEEWTQDWIVNELSKVFSHYEKEDVKRALFSTMNLFRLIAKEVADILSCEYPQKADDYATDWVENTLQLPWPQLDGQTKRPVK